MHAKPSATPKGGGILRQPTSVWATAFAAVVAFMGIGLGSTSTTPSRTPPRRPDPGTEEAPGRSRGLRPAVALS
ncbi:hypothetical protein SAMN06265355_103373 [Actinomadura mexicana]|uniref:Uncharacterized protein n=1 Tax=Actinomadura mexicana TaxID=134959 RepID=A0A238WYJ4_9ACTN|nr:hypothetical protein SAMN06265355_103373 [Actinomadura mexicana]